jgi:hypothetical protein
MGKCVIMTKFSSGNLKGRKRQLGGLARREDKLNIRVDLKGTGREWWNGLKWLRI